MTITIEIGLSAGAVAYGNTLYVSSGYAFHGLMPGDVLLAFVIQP